MEEIDEELHYAIVKATEIVEDEFGDSYSLTKVTIYLTGTRDDCVGFLTLYRIPNSEVIHFEEFERILREYL